MCLERQQQRERIEGRRTGTKSAKKTEGKDIDRQREMRAARDQRNRESREMKRKKVEFDPSSNGESERFPLLKKLLHLSFIFLSREL